jgi:hypothetical protein
LGIQDDEELHEYPNGELFASIKRFPARKELEVDGVMKPKGPTATALGAELFGTALPHRESELPQAAAAGADECYRRYEEVDIPTCRAFARKRGARAAVICYAAAAARLAACLAGKKDLPPLPPFSSGDDAVEPNPAIREIS